MSGLKIIWILIFAFILATFSMAQPFVCQANKYLTVRNGNLSEMYEIDIDALSGTATFIPLPADNVGVSLNAIGYRSTDNYIYGLDVQSKALMRVDASGAGEVVGNIAGLPAQMNYYGADCSPDGNWLVLIGSTFYSEALVFVNLADLTDPVLVRPLVSSEQIFSTDIAFHPTDGLLYGFDKVSQRIYSIDSNTGEVDFGNFPVSNVAEKMGAVFFDSFGTFYGYGTDVGSINATSLYRADLADGIVEKIATGPQTIGKDACSCPYTVELQKTVNPASAFPCTTVEYTFTLSNITDQVQSNLTLFDQFAPGLSFVESSFDEISGDVLSMQGDDFFEMENMNVPPGIHEIVIEVEIGPDVAGVVANQAVLMGLPANLGSEQRSDDPISPGNEDSTFLLVQDLFVDLNYDTFSFCNEPELVLDASTFGANYLWQDGSVGSQYTALEEGTYAVTVSTDCDVAVDSVFLIDQDLQIIEQPAIEIDLGESISISPIIVGGNNYDVIWNNQNIEQTSCENCISTMVSPLNDSNFEFYIDTGFGDCQLQGSIAVFVNKNRALFIPNVFSPNADGSNDRWEIFGVQEFKVNALHIFSRWGELVYSFETKQSAKSHLLWDGALKDETMQAGVFTWRMEVEFLDGWTETKEGDLLLLK